MRPVNCSRAPLFASLVLAMTLAGCSYSISTPGAGSAAGAPLAAALPAKTLAAAPFSLQYGDTAIDVELEPGRLTTSKADLERWVSRALTAVQTYYGKLPVPRIIIRVRPVPGDSVVFATSTHEDDLGYGLIEVDLGNDATSYRLDRSWELTHELIHLTFPIAGQQQRWVAEGIATYVEPLARMQAGQVEAKEVWGDLVNYLPRALPAVGEGGLNGVRGWGRMYWGGALFCLLCDIELRQQTNNRYGLQSALRAIADGGGTAASDWSVEQALSQGDRSTGTTVMTDTYKKLAFNPLQINLPLLFKQLGVSGDGESAAFDNLAPLAGIRRSIDKGS